MPDLLSNIAADTSLPVAYSDPILESSNAGCFVYDLGFSKSYAGAPSQLVPAASGTDPVTTDAVLDLGGNSNAAVNIFAGQTVAYLNRGFNYAASTTARNYVEVPAAFAAAIHAGTKQRFGVMAYERLPTAANWPADAVVKPSLSWTTLSTGAGLFMHGSLLQSVPTTAKVVRLYRETASGTYDQFTFALPDDTYCGRLMGFVFSRDETASYAELRILKADGTTWRSVSGTTAAGSENSTDFSAFTGKWGLGNTSYWGTTPPASRSRTLHRLALFDRNLDTRNLNTVFADDWTRFVARANVGQFGAL